MTSRERIRIQELQHTALVDKQVPEQQLGRQLARRQVHVVLKKVPKRLYRRGVLLCVRNRAGVCGGQPDRLDRDFSCCLEPIGQLLADMA